MKRKSLFSRLKSVMLPPDKLELPQVSQNYLEGMTQERLQEVYKQLFNTLDGRIVIADLEAKYGKRSSVVRGEGNIIDVNDVLVREGERRVLLRIKNLSRED